MKKFFRLFKYIALSMVFVAFAFLRWVSGGHADEADNKRLSKGDLKNLLLHLPEANADVPADGDGGGGDGGGDDGGDDGGGC